MRSLSKTQNIIKAIGGQTKTAQRLGVKVSTVGMWGVRDRIPSKYDKQVSKWYAKCSSSNQTSKK